jgi:hypothetical protein
MIYKKSSKNGSDIDLQSRYKKVLIGNESKSPPHQLQQQQLTFKAQKIA